MELRTLTALPVYNEADCLEQVLDGALRHAGEVLAVDDGSTDGTSQLLARRNDVHLVQHPQNRGYGSALKSAFQFARQGGYDILVTIDCDGQHQPRRIPQFIEACRTADVVSGSRYLRAFQGDSIAPASRREINQRLTEMLNRQLGLDLTDAFCGFKAYRVEALEGIELEEDGYAMPLEFWVQASRRGLRIVELPVERIYLDHSRSFGGALDDADTRLATYTQVLRRAIERSHLCRGDGTCLPCGEGTA